MEIYAYVRVSAKDQNPERQLSAMRAIPVKEQNIFLDKETGKDFDRPAYMRLIGRMCRGDLLIIKSIDRLGRNYDDIKSQWEHITKTIGADIRVLDMPLLIGDSHGYEGDIVWQDGPDYYFGYSERGKTMVLMKFPSEKDVIAYALKTLEEDRWSKAHLVAFLWDEKEVNQAETELRSMNISFERNDIPNYHEGKAAYRIFVFGKDILKLSEFKERYICMQRT